MIILELLFYLLFDVLAEAFFSLFRAFDEDEGAWPLAVALFVVVGLLVGGATAFVFPGRVLREGPFPGASLLVVPVLLGAFMELWGGILSRWGRDTSHLATWYGGASMGLGLAAGRFTMLQAGIG